MLYAVLFLVTLFLAYSNGANDNFKGVATLFGSGTADYRRAIAWATVTTFAGSICAMIYAQQLMQSFSGKGLVPDSFAASPVFLVAVGLGAAATVLLATVAGFPISTTHALIGGLLGAGLIAAGKGVNFGKLGGTFLLPLVVSPFIAVVCGAFVYFVFHRVRIAGGIAAAEDACICVDAAPAPESVPVGAMVMAVTASNQTVPVTVTIDRTANCARAYKGRIFGLQCQPLIDSAHYFSAGAVSFARGLNDTPKIVAVMLLIKGLNLSYGVFAVAAAMAVGGLLNARKVGETMSRKITPMNAGQGFTANLVTSLLVLFASRVGVPVSTTHVSVGSILGMGLVAKRANLNVMKQIALSWVLTLPIAAVLGAIGFLVLSKLG